MRLLLLTCLLVVAVSSAQGAGWCDRAERSNLNQVEITICDTPYLRELDSEMAAVYYDKENRSQGAELRRLKSEQFSNWLGYRNACQTNVRCLVNRYVARMAELQGDQISVGGNGRTELDIDERRVINAQSAQEFADSFNSAQNLKRTQTPDPVTGMTTMFANFDTTAYLDALVELTVWAEQRSVGLEEFFNRSLSPASAGYIASSAPDGNALHRLDFQLQVLSGLELRQ